jgi:hypothetical protein
VLAVAQSVDGVRATTATPTTSPSGGVGAVASLGLSSPVGVKSHAAINAMAASKPVRRRFKGRLQSVLPPGRSLASRLL